MTKKKVAQEVKVVRSVYWLSPKNIKKLQMKAKSLGFDNASQLLDNIIYERFVE